MNKFFKVFAWSVLIGVGLLSVAAIAAQVPKVPFDSSGNPIFTNGSAVSAAQMQRLATRNMTSINGARSALAGKQDKLLLPNDPTYFLNGNGAFSIPAGSGWNVVGHGSAAPSTGAHIRGDVFVNRSATVGQYMGFTCVSSGTPGTWAGFGIAGIALDGPATMGPTGKVILQQPDATFPLGQALSALGTGIVKNTTGTGVLSIAGPSDFPAHNAFFNTTGTHTWTCPAGVTTAFFTLVGGGGGGGGNVGPSTSAGGVCGQAGGVIAKYPVSVTPGHTYTIIVGAGGPGGTGNPLTGGSCGGDTSIQYDGGILIASGNIGGGSRTGTNVASTNGCNSGNYGKCFFGATTAFSYNGNASGNSANNHFGNFKPTPQDANGNPGLGYGIMGDGGWDYSGTTPRNGGSGASGMVLIEW